jgi:hypothetical protein
MKILPVTIKIKPDPATPSPLIRTNWWTSLCIKTDGSPKDTFDIIMLRILIVLNAAQILIRFI